MSIKKLTLENFTVFKHLDIDFSEGINVFIGQNGTGKTHVMKTIYSACQAARKDISFSNKLVRVFKPDDLSIGRLARRRVGNVNTRIKVVSDGATIKAAFSYKTKKWDAEVVGEEQWEKQLGDLTSLL